jgi:hypothetical protein
MASAGCLSRGSSWILACFMGKYSSYLYTQQEASGLEGSIELNAKVAFVGSPLRGGALRSVS